MESSKTGKSNSSPQIAKNLLIGKTCDNCIHQRNTSLEFSKEVCERPKIKNEVEVKELPQERTCDQHWSWRS